MPGPWQHGLIPVIGLIGGIGAGKSRVAALLAERDCFVIDADRVGHALLEQAPARDAVLEHFGHDILAPQGPDGGPAPIDRKVLGKIVFSDPAQRRVLESILHPAMRRTFEKAIARVLRRRQHRAVILDAAVLLEAGWGDLCDLVVFIESPEEARARRVAESRGWTAEQLAVREKSQLAVDRKRVSSDRIIANDGDEAALAAAVEEFWAWLKAENRRKHGEAAIERQAAARRRARGPSPAPQSGPPGGGSGRRGKPGRAGSPPNSGRGGAGRSRGNRRPGS